MFENVTKLTADILTNDFFFQTGWEPKEESNKLLEYYFNICAMTRELFYLRPTREQIEQYLTEGSYTNTDTTGCTKEVICPISDEAERKYYFRAAQFKQLKYDIGGGRGAMIRGEDKSTFMCADAMADIDALGLFQRTFMTR